ncbi:MAG: hypothetical protein JXA82_06405 [Sedimentisphaerales bacterium]|nr:hypothetical protein [Sedimentisphaerales bacterium]
MNRDLHHFHFILAQLIVLILAGAGIMFVLSRPQFETEAAIRIQPRIVPILFDRQTIPEHFEPYKNTQVALIRSNRILNRTVDELTKQKVDLDWMPDAPDILTQLKIAIRKNILSIQSDPRSELIRIRMQTRQPEQAQAIVNAMLHSYITVASTEDIAQEQQQLRILEDRKKVLEAEMEQLHHTIQKLEAEYDIAELHQQQERIEEQIKAVHTALMEQSMERIRLESRMVVETTKPQTPDRQQAIAELTDQIAQAREEEKRLHLKMDELDKAVIAEQPDYSEIKALNENLYRKQELHEQICRRIDQLTMEQQIPSRISIAYEASSIRLGPNRIFLVTVLAFAGLFSGAILVSWLAFAIQPKEPMRKTGENHERGSTDDETL